MFHTIEFRVDRALDIEISPRHRLEQVQVFQGTRATAQVKPYVVQTNGGFVEVADLFFADGPASRLVPFACFRFVDE